MGTRADRAQVLVLFALLLPMLLGMLGLTFTVGMVLTQRRAAQSAADAASLRGTWEVLAQIRSGQLSDTAVRAAVVEYAAANGIDPSDIQATYRGDAGEDLGRVGASQPAPWAARRVQVEVSQSVATFLPAFVGVGAMRVGATSTASLVPSAVPPPGPVVPLAANRDDFLAAVGLTFDLPPTTFDLLPPGRRANGRIPILVYGAGAAQCGNVERNLQCWSNGQNATGTVSEGDRLFLAPSTDESQDAVVTGLQDNLRRQVQTGRDYAIVTIPLWEQPMTSAGQTSVRIAGFAALRVRAADLAKSLGPGNSSTFRVRGVFVPSGVEAWGLGTTPAVVDAGSRLVRLTP